MNNSIELNFLDQGRIEGANESVNASPLQENVYQDQEVPHDPFQPSSRSIEVQRSPRIKVVVPSQQVNLMIRNHQVIHRFTPMIDSKWNLESTMMGIIKSKIVLTQRCNFDEEEEHEEEEEPWEEVTISEAPYDTHGEVPLVPMKGHHMAPMGSHPMASFEVVPLSTKGSTHNSPSLLIMSLFLTTTSMPIKRVCMNLLQTIFWKIFFVPFLSYFLFSFSLSHPHSPSSLCIVPSLLCTLSPFHPFSLFSLSFPCVTLPCTLSFSLICVLSPVHPFSLFSLSIPCMFLSHVSSFSLSSSCLSLSHAPSSSFSLF